MSLDKALAASQSEIPECVAAGYVEMATGMLLGVRTVDSHPPEVLDLVAAATGDLFQGRNVVEVENLFKKSPWPVAERWRPLLQRDRGVQHQPDPRVPAFAALPGTCGGVRDPRLGQRRHGADEGPRGAAGGRGGGVR